MSENPPTPESTPRGPSFEPATEAPGPAWGQPSDAAPGWAAPQPAPAPSFPQPAAPTWLVPAGHEGSPVPPVAPEPPAAERVGLGLLAAAGVVLACCALTAAIYHFGFIASITAWLMAIGAAWAYGVVGGRPLRGRVPLLVLIVVGVFLGFLSMVGSVVWDFYWLQTGAEGTAGEAIATVASNVFNLELWQDLGRDAGLYFLFAALGTYGVIRQMTNPRPVSPVN